MKTNKQLAAGQRRKLERIGRELVAMAAEWEDRDNYLVGILDEARYQLAETQKNILVDNEY